jgi:hypothetical protein
MVQARLHIKVKPCLKNNQQKRAGRAAQAAAHLPNNCKALNSNPSITKKWLRPIGKLTTTGKEF